MYGYPFITLETVFGDTPAWRATSRIVTATSPPPSHRSWTPTVIHGPCLSRSGGRAGAGDQSRGRDLVSFGPAFRNQVQHGLGCASAVVDDVPGQRRDGRMLDQA